MFSLVLCHKTDNTAIACRGAIANLCFPLYFRPLLIANAFKDHLVFRPVHLSLFFFKQKMSYKVFKVVKEFTLVRAIKYTSAHFNVKGSTPMCSSHSRISSRFTPRQVNGRKREYGWLFITIVLDFYVYYFSFCWIVS